MKSGVISFVLSCLVLFYGLPAFAERPSSRDIVRNSVNSAFEDEETHKVAKKKVELFDWEQVVRHKQICVESSSQLKDFTIPVESIPIIRVGTLPKTSLDYEEWNRRKICMQISAAIISDTFGMEGSRRQNPQTSEKEMISDSLKPEPAIGVRLWLNKPDGRFVEGDQLIIHVEVDQDVYLKLDYFQADGKVVHLVPNLFRAQAFVEKGKTYVFGGEDSPERFIIREPFGNEVIKAVASTEPFSEALVPEGAVSESQSYRKSLEKGLSVQPKNLGGTRGVEIIAGESGATISLFTSSQKASDFKETLEKN